LCFCPAKKTGELSRSGGRIKAAIFCGEGRPRGFRGEDSRFGRLFWKRAADESEAIGGPGVGFLPGAGVGDDEEGLEFEHGFLEALVARLRFHLAGVAKFQGGKGTVPGQGLPDFERIAGDAASVIEIFGAICGDGRFMSGEQILQGLQGQKCAATLKEFAVKGAAFLRKFVFPRPNELGEFVPSSARAVRDGIIERWKRYVFHGEENAKTD